MHVAVTQVKHWESVINNYRNWFTSYVEFNLECSIGWVYRVGEDFLNSVHTGFSKCRS